MSACQKFIGQVTDRQVSTHTYTCISTHASFSVNLCLSVYVCVCVCSCLFCLHCCCLTALITFVIIRTFSYQRWVLFVFLLSSVRACTPVIVACFALSLLLSLCFDSWRSLRRDLHLALALSLPNSLALPLLLLFSCLSAFIAPCGGASKQFEIYFLYYLFVLFESKLNHRLME